jgi:2-amino-4-hydroxy-6-hydroxymethyldihydropteridine diphosphokinase
MPRAYIALGSNIDPEGNLLAALRLLCRRARLIALSAFYRTPALDRPEQPPFYNGVAAVDTDLSPHELKFGVLRAIESELGRQRTDDRFAARPIDLDLVLYGDLVLCEADFCLPDPELLRRPFLAHPLLELAPDLVLPGTSLTLREAAARLSRLDLEPLPEYTARVRREVCHEP